MFTLLKAQLVAQLSSVEKGQDLAEYGMLTALVAVAAVAAVRVLGFNVLGLFTGLALITG